MVVRPEAIPAVAPHHHALGQACDAHFGLPVLAPPHDHENDPPREVEHTEHGLAEQAQGPTSVGEHLPDSRDGLQVPRDLIVLVLVVLLQLAELDVRALEAGLHLAERDVHTVRERLGGVPAGLDGVLERLCLALHLLQLEVHLLEVAHHALLESLRVPLHAVHLLLADPHELFKALFKLVCLLLVELNLRKHEALEVLQCPLHVFRFA
mmetsp:Transcript_101906/g.283564  ORF Transcript_101906/g.283564 Transcript_101906/m.283564 type:complete len:209 (+) Transcript_101906:1-627(+)